ncbi:MAG: hypothetical protein H7343_14360 [Undibacterium sp.]|nr:hypothetical protein [Opitutaceae bacterium]
MGCATTGGRPDREETTALSELHSFYVVRAADEVRGIDQVIVKELDLLGLEASSGPATAQPEGADGKITYLTMWVDNDLFKLEIEIRPMAKGAKAVRAGSYLQRKQPGGMVHELLEILLPPRKTEPVKK